jgi:large subunit ribosomal protein L10
MNASRKAKREEVDEIKQKIQNAKSVVIVDYKGLTVEQDTQLRKSFREAKVEYKVLKNTLVRLAFNELGYKDFDEALNGPTALAFGHEDALASAKTAWECAKKYEKFTVKCGMFESAFADGAKVEAYANVPEKPALLSMLLSVLQAPVRKLAVALNAVAELAP